MAQVGKTIVHPLTGERLTFLQTAATTGGDLLKISVDMAQAAPWRGPMSTLGQWKNLRS